MKKCLLGVLGAVLTLAPRPVGAQITHALPDQALADARTQGKPVLAMFVGRDWCPWSKKLKRDVLFSSDFVQWALRRVVLLEVDFPKNPRDPATQARLRAFADQYGVKDVPTVLLVDPSGKSIGRVRHHEQTGSGFVAEAEQILGRVFPAPSEISAPGGVVTPAAPPTPHTPPRPGVSSGVPSPTQPVRPLAPSKPLVPSTPPSPPHPPTGNPPPLPKTPPVTIPAGWLTSYDQALTLARQTGRKILADFTGSDWCGWCMRMKAEIFDTPEFRRWAKDHVILLEVDFPRTKPQSQELRLQNETLARELGIEGYPTILFLDTRGKRVGELSYEPSGPTNWLKKAEAIIR